MFRYIWKNRFVLFIVIYAVVFTTLASVLEYKGISLSLLFNSLCFFLLFIPCCYVVYKSNILTSIVKYRIENKNLVLMYNQETIINAKKIIEISACNSSYFLFMPITSMYIKYVDNDGIYRYIIVNSMRANRKQKFEDTDIALFFRFIVDNFVELQQAKDKSTGELIDWYYTIEDNSENLNREKDHKPVNKCKSVVLVITATLFFIAEYINIYLTRSNEYGLNFILENKINSIIVNANIDILISSAISITTTIVFSFIVYSLMFYIIRIKCDKRNLLIAIMTSGILSSLIRILINNRFSEKYLFNIFNLIEFILIYFMCKSDISSKWNKYIIGCVFLLIISMLSYTI